MICISAFDSNKAYTIFTISSVLQVELQTNTIHYLRMVTCKLSLCPPFIVCSLERWVNSFGPLTPLNRVNNTHKASANARCSATNPHWCSASKNNRSWKKIRKTTGSSHDKLNNLLFRRTFINSNDLNMLRSKLRVTLASAWMIHHVEKKYRCCQVLWCLVKHLFL